MNWFDASGLTSLAKTALKEAQKTIDKALDIQEPSTPSPERSPSPDSPTRSAPADFLSSWGLTTSGESTDKSTVVDQPITESPSKAQSQSLWGSFAGSFFEPDKSSTSLDKAARAKSLGSQDDLFSSSKLVVSEGHEGSEAASERKRVRSKTADNSRSDDRSARINRLSIVSCESGKNSSDSVEVLGSHSLKTTPDSEAFSLHSASHSNSTSHKLTSESVEILPDSLISPSSIECLGFDSCSATECSSSNVSPLDDADKKWTPTGESAATGRTADSVSLVADDDDDTISYNSVSECTAPTVLDTNGDDKPTLSPNPRLSLMRSMSDAHRPRLPDIKDSPTEPPASLSAHTINPSENYASSNDGSCSDRTLNADSDSFVMDTSLEDKKSKPPEKLSEVEMPEDTFTDKLSDSSSFYNVNITNDASSSETAAFVNVDKHQCSSPSDGSHKDKERVSPISSESRSELVKIGSDRTSTHTSGDELETATSSDIEIIPSPNGDNGHLYCRASPAKYAQIKISKLDGSSPHLVDLVLGKSVSKVRGHNRELSEASIQSNTSDESHSSENERLIRRICEMTELLETKDCRLAEISRSNVELAESNAGLKNQLEAIKSRHEAGDINTLTEDFTQRMSALEKKFQQTIREKDQLRKQMEGLKSESTSRRTCELENAMKEKDDMISQLREEGEKLSKQQFTQSNIIKKLRVKEKENEQVIKSLRDKIAEQTSELDRLKRAISAKEELEVSQIEAVYKLTTVNKKLDAELEETRSILDDTVHKLETSKTSLEAARRELLELQRSSSDMKRRRDALAHAERDKQRAELDVERLTLQLDTLRAKVVQDEARWASREEAVRVELSEARAAAAALEARVAEGAAGGASGALLAQLASLQHSAVERDNANRATRDRLTRALGEAERKLVTAQEMERAVREECASLQEHLATSEALRTEAEGQRDVLIAQCEQLSSKPKEVEIQLNRIQEELERLRADSSNHIAGLTSRLTELEQQLLAERNLLEAERRRSALLQEQLLAGRTTAGDISPPHSLASDSLSASLWTQEEGSETGVGGCGATLAGSVYGLEEVLSRLQRREGEVRALSAAATAHQRQLQQLNDQLASAQHELGNMQALRQQYDALLQMYGEKEEQTQELRLDLQDVTQLYKSQLDEMIALRRQLASQQ